MTQGPSPISEDEGRGGRFVALTYRHMESLFRTALRMLGGRVDRAEDAVQETYLRAWKYFDSFDETRDVRVWLVKVLRNAIYEGARREKRQSGLAAAEGEEGRLVSVDEYGAENILARPLGKAPNRLTDEEVLAALDKLPDEFRHVVLLAVVEGFKYREIADALDIPIGTVMSRLFRGRQVLRHLLRGYAAEEGFDRASGGGGGGTSGGSGGQGQVA